MTRTYLIRLDDACPTMHSERWLRMERLLDSYGVKPLVGVIPCNADPDQMLSPARSDFWQQVRLWEEKGWSLAMHGFDHILRPSPPGLNPIWRKSEFAGLPPYEQEEKIRKGWEEFTRHGLCPRFFFAPCHTFDAATLDALRALTPIRIISDTIALRPYRHGEFIFIPQFGGSAREMRFPGVFTFCFHPSKMSDADFSALESFLKAHSQEVSSFSELPLKAVKRKRLTDRLMSLLYFTYRKLRRR